MPFLETDELDPIGGRMPSGTDPSSPKPTPSFFNDVIPAAFREGNIIGSGAAYLLSNRAYVDEPGYNPLETIKGTKYERDYSSAFAGDRSRAETEDRMARIDQEMRDQETLAAAGVPGFVAMIGLGILDPTILLPGGALYRSATTARNVLRSGASVAAMSAAGAAVQETVLQATQETRSLEESALNVGAATILGGILGAGASGLLSAAERAALANQMIRDAEAGFSPIGPAPAPAAASAGAAAADIRQASPVGYYLDKVPIIGEAVRRVSPTLDIMSSASQTARRAVLDLAETALRTVDAEQGIPQSFNGAPLERQVRMWQRQARMAEVNILETNFFQMRGTEPGVLKLDRITASDMARGAPEGAMTFDDFKVEIAKAMRRGDSHENPHVTAAAQQLRAQIWDPVKDRLIAANLLPEDIKPETAISYLHRMYDKDRIVANAPEFVKRTADWYEGEQVRKGQIQREVESLAETQKQLDARTAKLEGRLERLNAAQEQLAARVEERVMEARRAGKREGVLLSRKAELEAMDDDFAEFIGAVREQLREPDLLKRLDDLEAEYKAARAAEKRERVTDRDLEAADQAELDAFYSDKVVRQAAEIVTGKRNPVKEPSFAHYIASGGGMLDPGGDIAAAGGRRLPGLIRRDDRVRGQGGMFGRGGKSAKDADDWGEALMDNWNLPERPTRQEVEGWVADSLQGIEPQPFLDNLSADKLAGLEATRLAASIQEAASRAGVDLKGKKDVAAFLRGEGEPASLAAIERELADMEAAGASIPASIRLEDAETQLFLAKDDIAKTRAALAKARQAKTDNSWRIQREGARASEAGISLRSNTGRIGVLQDRANLNAIKQEVIRDALAINREMKERIWKNIEEQVEGWGGKSTRDAVRALRARADADLQRAVKAYGMGQTEIPRSASADSDLTLAVRRILGSEQDLSRQELEDLAKATMSNILGTPEGRLHFGAERDDYAFSGKVEAGVKRGPLAKRSFMIPDDQIEEFLVNDVEQLTRGLLRTAVPDVMLYERFGDFDMRTKMKEIDEEYTSLISNAKSEKERARLTAERTRIMEKLGGVRDRIRGTYGWSDKGITRNIGRVANVVLPLQMLAQLGTAAFNSLGDMAGVVMRHHFDTVLRDAWLPFLGRVAGLDTGWKEARHQLEAMGVAAEVFHASHGRPLADVQSPYQLQSKFEKAAGWVGDRFQMANLQAPWTDWAKTAAGIVTMNEMYRATRAVAGGKATKRQLAMLAEAGIEQADAVRIFEQYDASKSVIRNTILPNTADWTDKRIRDLFEQAVAREVEIAVVTPGQEKPLWMSTPAGSIIAQFKTFNMAATERLLLANLQRSDAATLQGMITAVSAGMISAAIYSALSGKEPPKDASQWVKEGISRSGLMGWFDEANTIMSKATRGQGDIYRLIGADRPLSKFANNGPLGQLGGPMANNLEKLWTVTGDLASGEASARTIQRGMSLGPFYNFWLTRRLMDDVANGTAGLLGLEQNARP